MRRILVLGLVATAALALWLRTRTPGAGAAVETPSEQPAPSAPVEAAAKARSAAEPEPESESPATDARVPGEPAPPSAGRLAGRLLDERTGEPVPWYALELVASDGSVRRTMTGADGRFDTADEVVFGKVRVRLVDDDRQASASQHRPVAIEHRSGAAPHEVRIEVGPTYLIDVAPSRSIALSELRVHLFRDPPEFDEDDRAAPETIVRASREGPASAWVRFREPRQVVGTPLWLRLSSRDGLLEGGARVPGGEGTHPDVVRIELLPRCAVRGRYVAAGAADLGFPALALFRAEDLGAPRWAHGEREGRFRLAGLAPGTYRLEVRDPRLRAAPASFTLVSGELDLGELRCDPIPLAGSVRLRVRSAIEVPLDVSLVRRFDPPRHPPWHSDAWEPLAEGGFESRFEWDEIYAGEYEVEVHSHGLGEWHLALGALEPPVEDLALSLPPPAPPLRLAVADAETGVPLADWSVLVRGERAWEELDGAPDSLAFAVRDEESAFAISSDGYRAWVASGESPAWREAEGELTIRLQRGWSRLFLARRRSRGTPVAGASIALDGLPAGTTDARGELWVHAAAPATRLEVSHPSLVWADRDGTELADVVTWIVLRP